MPACLHDPQNGIAAAHFTPLRHKIGGNGSGLPPELQRLADAPGKTPTIRGLARALLNTGRRTSGAHQTSEQGHE